MRGNETKVLLGILDDMIKHFNDTNNQSFLVRIYGVFTIQTDVFGTVDILLMENTLKRKYKNPFVTFDLKGSLVNR